MIHRSVTGVKMSSNSRMLAKCRSWWSPSRVAPALSQAAPRWIGAETNEVDAIYLTRLNIIDVVAHVNDAVSVAVPNEAVARARISCLWPPPSAPKA